VQNPTNQVHESLLKVEVPYRDFEVKQLLPDGTSKFIKYDQFKPKIFFNSEYKQNKTYMSFPISFNEYEDHKVYLVTKKKGEEKEAGNQTLTETKVDTSVAKESNFKLAPLGKTITYGQKSLTYIGM
jgi:hypothetical protein